jgi:hypothetical protein
MKHKYKYEEGAPLLPGKYAGPKELAPEENSTVAAVKSHLPTWLLGITLPPVVFYLATILGSKHRRDYPTTLNLLYVCIALMLVLAVFLFNARRPFRGNVAMLTFIGMLSGSIFGYYLFVMYYDVYFQFRNLVTYVNLDPARDVGGAYMDAGEVYFKEGSRIDTGRAIAVMSKDVFCVAPIVREEASSSEAELLKGLPPPPSGTMDWWVVGKNCCQPDGEQFTCGIAGLAPGVYPRAGLRLLEDYQRHLYKMAVDEWSSKYGIPTTHPLFFMWEADPLATVVTLQVVGWTKLLFGLQSYIMINFILATFGTAFLASGAHEALFAPSEASEETYAPDSAYPQYVPPQKEEVVAAPVTDQQ